MTHKEIVIRDMQEKLALSNEKLEFKRQQMTESRTECDHLKLVNESLVQANRLKEDAYTKLEHELDYTVNALVDKNNYLNQLQSKMVQFRGHYSFLMNSPMISHGSRNIICDAELLDLLFSDLSNKSKALLDLRKLTEQKIGEIERQLKLLKTEEQYDCPLDEVLIKVTKLKESLVRNMPLPAQSDSDEPNPFANGGHPFTCLTLRVNGLQSTVTDAEKVKYYLAENCFRKLHSIAEDILRFKTGKFVPNCNVKLFSTTNQQNCCVALKPSPSRSRSFTVG